MVTSRTGHLERRSAVSALLKGRGDGLVVTGLGSATYDVFAAGDSTGNMYLWGAMGGAAMVGLGLAQAQPRRPVIVVTGDGELLMGLGSLAVVAVKAPSNLTIVVLDNGYYQETGGQRSHTGQGVDLCAVGAALGLASTCLETMDAIEAYRPKLTLLTGGPRVAIVSMSNSEPPRAIPIRDGVHLKNRFREHLGFPLK